jgi:hypothetical protein
VEQDLHLQFLEQEFFTQVAVLAVAVAEHEQQV